ncbi:MAG: CcoQ/FixQ family Cbb3-type cytochrome c oxidase assembly chaperone [Burkholderiales bacterium]|jgi:cytochrome c oxidase cbb3-type subunit 4|nr:CcoQ/FixQ family Cbb3-type cytochrome c oxidase assembly chaperone [Burkholderiales bacterium]
MSGVVAVVGTVTTVLAVTVFVGIVFWAYSRKRRQYFDHAAQAPFALPDDADGIGNDNSTKQDID